MNIENNIITAGTTLRDITYGVGRDDPNAKTVNVTFDWNGVDVDTIVAMAEKSLAITLQSRWRRDMANAPTGAHTVTVADAIAPQRRSAPKLTPAKAAEMAMSDPAFKAQLLALLKANGGD